MIALNEFHTVAPARRKNPHVAGSKVTSVQAASADEGHMLFYSPFLGEASLWVYQRPLTVGNTNFHLTHDMGGSDG